MTFGLVFAVRGKALNHIGELVIPKVDLHERLNSIQPWNCDFTYISQ